MIRCSVTLAIALVVADACKISYYKGGPNCWVDSLTAPILPYQPQDLSPVTMDLNTCATACHSSGHTVMGLRGGRSPVCMCGSSPRLTETANKCNDPCPGNPSEICGGTMLLMTLYDFSCGPADVWGLSDKMGLIFLITGAIAVVGYAATVAVLTFAFAKEGSDRFPLLPAAGALLSDGSAFVIAKTLRRSGTTDPTAYSGA